MKYFGLLLLFITSNFCFTQSYYRTGFDTEQGKAGWVEFRKGKMGNARWFIGAGGTNKSNQLSHSAPTGDANKDSLVNWYVSPKFDFSEGGSLDSLKYIYFTALNTFHAEQVVQVYLLEDDPDPAKATKTTLLLDLTNFYYGEGFARDTVWRDTGNITIGMASSNAYVAFKFVAIDGWSSISFDDIHIKMNKTSNLEKLETVAAQLYPNPSNGNVSLHISSINENTNLVLNIYTIAGVKVKSLKVKNNTRFPLELEKGVYFYSIRDENAISLPQRIILL